MALPSKHIVLFQDSIIPCLNTAICLLCLFCSFCVFSMLKPQWTFENLSQIVPQLSSKYSSDSPPLNIPVTLVLVQSNRQGTWKGLQGSTCSSLTRLPHCCALATLILIFLEPKRQTPALETHFPQISQVFTYMLTSQWALHWQPYLKNHN